MNKSFLFIAICLIPVASFSFDGHRKGLNLGLGVGFSPHASFDWENRIDEVNSTISGRFLIGYAVDNSNVFAYQGFASVVTSKKLNNTSILQGLWGPRWYHYFGSADHKRLFGSAGIGWLRFWSDFSNVRGSGVGYEVGLGYEIMRHFQLELYYYWGETESSNYNTTADHSVLSLLVSAYAF